MNKDLMLKNLGGSDITVRYKAEWIGGDGIVTGSFNFSKNENYADSIPLPFPEISENNKIAEGILTVPSTHIYGEVTAGGYASYLKEEECVGIQVIPYAYAPRFKLVNNNVYLVVQTHNGY